DTYVFTPSLARVSRSPAVSGARLLSHPAYTRSGSFSSTASWEGALSDSCGIDSASSAHRLGTGPSLKARATTLSPKPSASSSSVAVDLIVTTRSGADSKVCSIPQLVTVTG